MNATELWRLSMDLRTSRMAFPNVDSEIARNLERAVNQAMEAEAALNDVRGELDAYARGQSADKTLRLIEQRVHEAAHDA